MKEYLKMADVLPNGVVISPLHSEIQQQYADHAINSHDELVEMNKDLLAALELMLLIHDEPSGFCGKFGKELDMAIEDQKEKIDTRIAVAINAIAKAKAAS